LGEAIARLTDLVIKSLPAPRTGQKVYRDDLIKGFGVRVSPGGAKTFLLIQGKERAYTTIGRAGVVSLAQAREKARDILAARQLGIAHDAPRMSFAEAFTLFMQTYEAKNRPKSIYEMKRIINRHLMPKLRHRDLAEITTQDIASAIERLIPTPGECHALFKAARTLFRWMEKRRLIERSPIGGLDAPSRVVSRDRLLTDAELSAVLRNAIADASAFGRIVELLIRTGQRVKQIAHLRAEWINYEQQTITWPRDAMKSAREHTIPYGTEVAGIFATLPKKGILFPARGRDTPFNGFSKSKEDFDKKLEAVAPYVLHDFRRNFSSGCAAIQVDPITVERILAHAIPGIAGVYNRYSYLEPMRDAHLRWQAKLASLLNPAAQYIPSRLPAGMSST
jgi:integrase